MRNLAAVESCIIHDNSRKQTFRKRKQWLRWKQLNVPQQEKMITASRNGAAPRLHLLHLVLQFSSWMFLLFLLSFLSTSPHTSSSIFFSFSGLFPPPAVPPYIFTSRLLDLLFRIFLASFPHLHLSNSITYFLFLCSTSITSTLFFL